MQTKLAANCYPTDDTTEIADKLVQSAICWSLLRGCAYISGIDRIIYCLLNIVHSKHLLFNKGLVSNVNPNRNQRTLDCIVLVLCEKFVVEFCSFLS